MAMSSLQRKRQIIDMLKNGNPISVKELGDMLSVSAMTVRRDLSSLELEGRLKRSHGWAEPVHTEEYEPSYIIRLRENTEEKSAICRQAAALIKDGDVVFLDVGTTLLDISRHLGNKKDVTVITYWLPHVMELAKQPNIRTIVPGGVLRNSELSLVGMIPKRVLRDFNVSICFISIGGVSIEKGVTDYNLDEVEVKKIAIDSASKKVLVVDHTKLGRVAPVRVIPISAIDTIITDSKAESAKIDILRSAGIEVIVAE